jgi:signal transduction histidine kinase
MFSGLRLRLTLLYLLAALTLIAAVSGGAYWLLSSYFQSSTDLALEYRMSQQFRQLGASLPPALMAAERAWTASRPPSLAASLPRRNGDDGENEGDEVPQSAPHSDDIYDAELAAIFVLPLDAAGRPSAATTAFAPLLAPDQQAVAAAIEQGQDVRTTSLSNGTRVRLLTYRVDRAEGAAIMQAGRALNDQDRVLRRLLLGLIALGGLSAVLLSMASWWLAGRSLHPAQQAWARQQAFVANASHELRAPLTLLRASAEVALRGVPKDARDQRALLEDVLHESDHMNRLVDDLLLLSRLDAGRLAIERSPVALGDLLADVERQIGRLAEERGVRLTVGAGQSTVQGDRTRLRQVLLILLDNALRHTPSGGAIAIDTRRRDGNVEIVVADTGSGIPAEHLPHVFERFYRAAGARGEDGQGSGLGLSIAKALVDAQHGQIAIASQLGNGTQVTVSLPSAA